MKHLLLTTIAAVVLVETAFADLIHDAARNGDLVGVQAELDKGVDVNVKDVDGMTSLFHAVHVAIDGHKEIVKLLIASGADVNAKDIHGMTPLFHAVRKGQKEMAELLLDEGAHVNLREKRGSTLLHGAAALGHQEIAELLINAGADVNAIDKRRWTPLDWAIWEKSTITADLIRIHGGKTSRELKELMPRLTYNRELFGFSFTAKGGIAYMVQVTQDFKHWGDLKTINGTGEQVKSIDPRQPLVPFKRNFYRVRVIE